MGLFFFQFNFDKSNGKCYLLSDDTGPNQVEMKKNRTSETHVFDVSNFFSISVK